MQQLVHNNGNIMASESLFVRRQKCGRCNEFKPQCFRLRGKLICRECNKAMIEEKQKNCRHDQGLLLGIVCTRCGAEVK